MNSALDAGQWSASHSSRFTPGEGEFVSHCIETLMGFKIGLVDLVRRKFLPRAGNNASNSRPLSAQNKTNIAPCGQGDNGKIHKQRRTANHFPLVYVHDLVIRVLTANHTNGACFG